jgi:hypothetical protein
MPDVGVDVCVEPVVLVVGADVGVTGATGVVVGAVGVVVGMTAVTSLLPSLPQPAMTKTKLVNNAPVANILQILLIVNSPCAV